MTFLNHNQMALGGSFTQAGLEVLEMLFESGQNAAWEFGLRADGEECSVHLSLLACIAFDFGQLTSSPGQLVPHL